MILRGKYKKIKEIVEKEMKRVGPSHGFSHVMRVYRLALNLAKYEKNVNLDVLKAAVLLHDIARAKEDNDNTGKTDHAVVGAEMAGKILRSLHYSKEKIQKIQYCILTHRFKKNAKAKIIEAKILFDADKLDACGAIGLARSASWIGEHKAKIYSGESLSKFIKKDLVGGKSNGIIKNKTDYALNFEYQLKIKHIIKRLYTKKAKEIARERIKFMRLFFNRLAKEIKGTL